MVSSIIRCGTYKLTVYAGFTNVYGSYNPTAAPFIPVEGSSFPSERPLPEASLTGPSSTPALDQSGILGGRGNDSQSRVEHG